MYSEVSGLASTHVIRLDLSNIAFYRKSFSTIMLSNVISVSYHSVTLTALCLLNMSINPV